MKMSSVEQSKIENSLVLERRQKNLYVTQRASNICTRTLQDKVIESNIWRGPIHLQTQIQKTELYRNYPV